MQICDESIDLWMIPLSSVGDRFQEHEQSLSTDERQRATRFRSAKERRHFTLARGSLRPILSQYLGTQPEAVRFSYGTHGKPRLANTHEPSLEFNLSHSGDRLVLAISKLETIGVDIESSDKPRRVARIAQRFFSRQEVADLLVLSQSRRLHRFYQLWTLKEAYIKACGLGLAIPLRQFSYAFPTAGQIEITFDKSRQDDATRWQVWQFDVPGNYQLSLAVKSDSGDQVGSISSWNLPDLKQFHSLDTCISRSN